MRKKLLLLGYGFSAHALAQKALALNYHVIGTHRTIKNNDDNNVEKLLFDANNTELKQAIISADYIVSSIPPSRDSNIFNDAAIDVFGDVLQKSRAVRVIYFSTTGVYGDYGGDYCDENSPLQPTSARGMARVHCEKQWQQKLEDRLTIMRLPGIYGPYRNILTQISKQQARYIVKEHQVFSRIHIDDLADACLLSFAHDKNASIYNICDDLAAPPQDLVRYGCMLLNQDLPEKQDFKTACDNGTLSDMAQSFYRDNKRIDNHLAKKYLGWQPFYKDYITALHQLYLTKQY